MCSLGDVVFFLDLMTPLKMMNNTYFCIFLLYLLVVLRLIKETWAEKQTNKQKRKLILLMTGKARGFREIPEGYSLVFSHSPPEMLKKDRQAENQRANNSYSVSDLWICAHKCTHVHILFYSHTYMITQSLWYVLCRGI